MKKTLLFLALMPFCFLLQAQTVSPSVTNSTGGSATFTGGYLAWSVGEPIVGTVSSTATITQGFLQTWPDALKNLMLTLYLEGLYNKTSGQMNQAMDGNAAKWGTGVADKITVELHASSKYDSTVYTKSDVILSTAGQATLTVPSANYHSYYVTVKHRNSIETVSNESVSFSGLNVIYNFSDNANKAFGDNLKKFTDSPLVYGIYAGDVNSDGKVDNSDASNIKIAASSFSTGYLTNDVNGDGIVDALDLIMVDNNAEAFVSVKKP